MKIIQMHVNNIKRIKAVDVNPKGNTVIIGGKNANGKSSTLDAIVMALGGAKHTPEKPVRDGEETAEIRIDLGDYIVTKHWTNPTTPYLKLEGKDGAKIGNAQTVLDRLVGDLSFDPLEYTLMPPDKRLQILRRLSGVDFDALDAAYREAYESRTEANKEYSRVIAHLKTFDDVPDSIPDSMPIEEIRAERDKAAAHNESINPVKAILGDLKNRQFKQAQSVAHIQSAITARKHSIREAEIKIENIRNEIKDLASKEVLELKALDETIATVTHEQARVKSHVAIDLKAFDAQIDEYHSRLKIVERAIQKHAVKTNADSWAMTKDAKDELVKEAVERRAKAIADAPLPIKGLSITETGKDVLYEGIPFGQLAKSEQIRVSFAMAVATNPKLRVALIRDGSLLDKEGLEAIKSLAEHHDYQVWIERVMDGPESGVVYIEDGSSIDA